MLLFCRFSTGGCFVPFDTDSNGELSIDEFSELCYKLFVGTGDEINYGTYDFDPRAIFNWLTADSSTEAGMNSDTSVDRLHIRLDTSKLLTQFLVFLDGMVLVSHEISITMTVTRWRTRPCRGRVQKMDRVSPVSSRVSLLRDRHSERFPHGNPRTPRRSREAGGQFNRPIEISKDFSIEFC